MAKFIYKMQNILDIKLRLETQAKTEYAEAKADQNANYFRTSEKFNYLENLLKIHKAFYKKLEENLSLYNENNGRLNLIKFNF